MTYTIIMNSRGQITIPAAIRQQLGFKAGDTIRIEMQGNAAVVFGDDSR